MDIKNLKPHWLILRRDVPLFSYAVRQKSWNGSVGIGTSYGLGDRDSILYMRS
jgi:hypothetical protein